MEPTVISAIDLKSASLVFAVHSVFAGAAIILNLVLMTSWTPATLVVYHRFCARWRWWSLLTKLKKVALGPRNRRKQHQLQEGGPSVPVDQNLGGSPTQQSPDPDCCGPPPILHLLGGRPRSSGSCPRCLWLKARNFWSNFHRKDSGGNVSDASDLLQIRRSCSSNGSAVAMRGSAESSGFYPHQGPWQQLPLAAQGRNGKYGFYCGAGEVDLGKVTEEGPPVASGLGASLSGSNWGQNYLAHLRDLAGKAKKRCCSAVRTVGPSNGEVSLRSSEGSEGFEVWQLGSVIVDVVIVRLKLAWFLALGSLSVAAAIVVFYSPGLALPDKEEFQLFTKDHPFERLLPKSY